MGDTYSEPQTAVEPHSSQTLADPYPAQPHAKPHSTEPLVDPYPNELPVDPSASLTGAAYPDPQPAPHSVDPHPTQPLVDDSYSQTYSEGPSAHRGGEDTGVLLIVRQSKYTHL